MTETNSADLRTPRTAVLLYGLLREIETAAPSFLRHVVAPRNADVFYAGPAATDRPSVAHKGQFDLFGGVKSSPKAVVDRLVSVDIGTVQRLYGDRLKAVNYHTEPLTRFSQDSAKLVDPKDWLFRLNPTRMLSMFFNIEAVVELFLAYEKENAVRYDEVIITRPDLAFYGPISGRLKANECHVPSGEGFDAWGNKHVGSAPVFYYRNVNRGWYVPAGRNVRFNDQIMYFQRQHLELFRGLYESLCEYLSLRVPASPETVLYLHLISIGGLRPVMHPEWLYEIRRAGMPSIESVLDTTEIMFADRNHPMARRLRRRHPITAILRDGKILLRKIRHRLIR